MKQEALIILCWNVYKYPVWIFIINKLWHTNITYLASSSSQAIKSQASSTKQAASTQSTTPIAAAATATHIIRNQAGQQQVVYVSNHHPTLGHVGPMVGFIHLIL